MSADDRAAEAAGEHPPVAGQCMRCVHWADDLVLLEARIAGLASLGSAYGASIGANRLCLRLDRLTLPGDRCGAFEAAKRR
ncbi:hypothetical protein [Paraburkholderia lycopersici]|uniref:Uncharacterized protein n=1 Tax=Paraburkholderia lycopersici TaxID=416944 RepID=A0A1G6X7S2_9BURK|nr:hypothetical protein [Paraburkholderia lycopersici]SDD73337.1 hypothetical protein SAMN05421548_12478 [Paraburkholderia lycopersici]